MQGGSSNTTQRPGHERREVFPTCDEKAKEKTSYSLFFITETFSTVLPPQPVPLGRCHADTGVALQKHRKHRSFRALNVLKTDFFFLVRPSGWSHRGRDPKVNTDVLQLEGSSEEVQALLKHRKETLQFTESTRESPTPLIFLKGRLMQTLSFEHFFIPAAFSRTPSQRTKPCCARERRCIHS